MNKPKILITSALPYVNNVPHLGNIIGCVLSADVFARYSRLRGREVLYICGTDEYGTATQAKAIEENLSPKELCDKYHKIHKEIYEWFSISFDRFGRTSTDRHTQIVQQIFLQLHKNGYTTQKEIEQAYDEKLDMFLADRFIEGECPFCKSENARADQCDECGKLLTFSELIKPKSKLSGVKPALRKSEHIHIDLPKIQPKLEEWISKVEESGRWSDNTISIAKSWLKKGLEQRSITRDLKWGVPVPLSGFEKKVFYVWFDAPIGYISICANHTDRYMEWWNGEQEVKHYEFIGKDNVPFHSIMFPATLFGTGEKWTMPHFISSTEFLNYEGGKFSKSRGKGVFGTDARKTGIPADVWRYYLISNRPETSDNSFSWDEFREKTNNELLANFGNLVNRTLVFIENNFDGILPSAQLVDEDKQFLEGQRIKIAKIAQLLENVKLRSAMAEIMSFSANANKYFQDNAPWKLLKEDETRGKTVMNVLSNQILDMAIMSSAFLPNTSDEIYRQLNIGKMRWDQAGVMGLKAGHKLGKPKHLFSPIEKKRIEEMKEQFGAKGKRDSGSGKKIGIGDVELEVGLIEDVRRHPNADKLYVEKVLMADGEVRQIVSGLVEHLQEDEILGKTCIVVKNLKPAKLRGELSEGMLLAADNGEEIEIVSPDAIAGTKISVEGVERKEKFGEIGIEDFFSLEMKAQEFVILANGKKLIVDGTEIRTSKVESGKVK